MSDATTPTSAPVSTPSTSAPAPAPATPTTPTTPTVANDNGGGVPVSNDNGGPARQAPPLWSDDAEVEVVGFDGKPRKLTGKALVDYYRKGDSANAKYQEAAAIKREWEQIQAGLKTPAQARAILAKIGVSPRQFAEEMLKIELEEERLTPEQRELRDLRAQREEWQRQQEEEDAEYEAQEQQRQMQAFQQEVTRRFTKAIEVVMPGESPEYNEALLREMSRLARIDAQQTGQYRTPRAYAEAARDNLERIVMTRAERLAAQRAEEAAKAAAAKPAPAPEKIVPEAPAPPKPRHADGRFAPEGPRPSLHIRSGFSLRR